jgi:phenylacetate-CoA ligase
MSLAQRIYPHLPVAGQNLALAAFGLRYRRQRLGPGFDQYVAAFRERDRWSEEMMRSHTVQRLRELLLWSFQTVPYYTVRWQEAGIEEGDLAKMDVEDLAGLPITPKEDVRRDPTALVSTTLPRRPRLQRHLTSGSTGTPTTIYFTPQNVRQAMAVREARSFGWAGVSVRMPRSTIGARLVAPQTDSNGPVYRYNPIEHQLYLSAHHISRENLPSYVEGFNRYRPQVLTGFAYSHYLLARLMLAEGVRLQYQPQAAVLGSDKITPPMKATIAEAFGARAFEEYGAVENCVLATECTEGSLHVSPDFGILEILDADGAPAAPGQPGRLICTGLLNRAQPLIRYAIGDLGAWSKRHCSCGRDGLPVLESIVGRDTDVVVMRDGRRLNTAVALIFTGARGVAEGQVVQDGYEDFTIRVVPTTEFGVEQEEKLKIALRKRIGDVRIRVQTVEELEKTTSGKSRLVISRLRDNNDHNG